MTRRLTVWDWLDAMVESQWGCVPYLEWCRRETLRINGARQRRMQEPSARIVYGEGLLRGKVAIEFSTTEFAREETTD